MTMALVAVLRKPPWEMGDPFTGDGLYGPAIQRLVALRDVRAKPVTDADGWARAAIDPGLATVRRINRGDRTRDQVVAWLNADLQVPLFVVYAARFRQTFAKIAMRPGRAVELDLDEPDLSVFETVAALGKVKSLVVRVVSPQTLSDLPRWKAAAKKLAPAALILPERWRIQLDV
jgi:hypothetical protein